MKHTLRNYLFLLFLPICLLTGIKASASHFYGADLNYTWVSGNTYTVTLTVFGDCGGSSFPALNGSTAEIKVYNNTATTAFATLNLTQVGAGVEVTPVCPSQASNTNCSNALSTIPGVTRYIYSGNVTLNTTSTNWRFVFTGNLSLSIAGRSNSITNITSGSVTVLEARLNNVVGNNSSVAYTTIPTPFFCINKPANYNPGAVDPNLDSLSFSLVTGLNSPGTVTYVSPYTATAPLATSTGSYSFSTTNGQISFTPNATQRALIVSQVAEYRNGVLVGTSMREMTFVVLNTCSNNPPGGTTSNQSSGVASVNGTTVAACASLGIISFKINPTDADGDHINMQVAGLPAGATFSITGNNGYTPSGTFTWNITNVTPGTYNFFVTFTDDGCSLSSKQSVAYTVVVYGKPNPGFVLTSAATCAAKARFSLTPFAGAPPYTVSITGGAVADTFRNVSGTVTDSVVPGTYVISTVSGIGCSYDTTITFAPPSNLSVSAMMTSPTCVGGANGSLTAAGAFGVTPYTYAIGSGSFSSANTFTGLSAGTYIIHVKDAGGCSKDSAFTVVNPADIYAAVSFSRPPCDHFGTGSVTLTGYNSVAPYTYALGAGAYGSSGTFTGLFSGSYTVHIRNSLGCTKDTVVVLPDSVKITATIPVVNALCFGNTNGSVTINASGAFPPYVYAIGTGAFGASNTFNGLAAGTYIIHVRDTALCYFDTTITITQPAVLTITPTVTANVSCNGGNSGAISVLAGGGTPAYTYNINATPFGGSSTFSSLPAATYTLGVKDANGCTQSATATVTQPAPIVVGYTTVAPNCSYSADGSVTITGSGGTPGYTYSVDGAAYTSSGAFTGLSGGAHVLHVKDAANCIKDSSINLVAPARIVPAAALRSSTCATLGDGVVTLSATGGTPGYTYAKGAGTYGASGIFSALAAGTYIFHVKDTHGCIGDTSVTIIDSLVIRGNVTVTDVVCFGQNNGSIMVTGTGGQTPYTYALGAGAYTAGGSFSPLANGPYVLHIKDLNGCIKDTALSIIQPTLLVPSAAVTNVLCNGATTGVVTISASGGSPGYTYAQGTGAYGASGTFSTLAAGTYTFHVKDTHNCISDTVITITQPAAIAITATKTNVLCNGGGSGTVTITASGGTPGYTYAADAGAYSGSNILTSLNAGTHTIHTKDANGCIKDTSINITQPTPLALGYTTVSPLCNGDANGTITISASGGTSPYLYAINSSSFTATTIYSGRSAGVYVLHIKDANNCTKDSTITLTEPAPLALTLAVTNVLCNGGASGTVTVTASGGTAAYTYAIDAGAFGSGTAFAGLLSGVHTVHLKDANNCTKDSTFTITQPSVLRLGYTSTQPLCNGDANGSITISGIGGTTPYQYALNTGAFGSSGAFTGLIAGTYTLHVKDTNGCTKDSIITLGQPIALTLTATKTNVLCNGGSSGTVTITGAGGILPYTYAADAGAFGTSNVLTGLNAGTYAIHLKDVNGCTKDTNITITEPTRVAMGYTSVKPLCSGDANGSITISASGGTPAYQYSLGSGAFSSTTVYSGLAAGTYVLHIKDANNCTKDSTITLTEPAPLAFTLAVTNVLCNGGTTGTVTVTASGGTATYTYAIDAGAFGSSPAFTGLLSGVHTVHLKDANNCTKDSTFTITQPSVLRLSYTITQPLCNGGNDGIITISGIGGTTPYQYALNTGAFGSNGTFNALIAGTYTLHVKDNNGCTKDSIITLGQPIALTLTATKTNVLCNGGSSGTVTVTGAGGVLPYTYAADAGAFGTSNVLTGLNAGTHAIHLKDVNGCTKDTNITITEPTRVAMGYTSVKPLCNGDANGSITISASGGTPAYQYSLGSGAFSSTTVYSGLAAGTYVLHIKDANNCTKDSIITLTEPAPLAFTFTVANVLCNGGTGSVSVVAGGGTAAYTYAIDAGAFGSATSFTGLAAGGHTVHLKDANGCTKDSTFTITQPSRLSLSYTAVQPLCNGDTNGSITITGIGGTPAYQYAIGTGAFGASGIFTGRGAGTYILHVKDANGCTKDSTITLGQPAPLAFSLTITNVRCSGTSSGTVTVTANGGILPYTYAIDAGAYTTSNLFTALPAGSHTIHLKDVNGCIKDSTFNITQPATLSLQFTSVNPLCNGGFTGSITITGAGGTTPYTYALNSGAFSAVNAFSSLGAGLYALHLKDANGCLKDSNITLTEPPLLAFSLAVTNVLCNGGSTGTVTVTASGGTLAYQYAADAGAFGTGNVLTGLAAGAHVIHLKDANGCTKDSNITITQPALLTLTYTFVRPLCNGDTNGSLTITGAGGTLPYQYSLNGGAFGSSGVFTNLGARTDTLRLRDANGCTKDSIINFTQPAKLAFTLAVTNVLCNGGSTGTVTVTASGGTLAYQYAADAGAFGTGNVLTGLAAGTHAIHLKDANGCTKDSTINITQPAVLNLGYTATQPLCNAGTNGTVTITGTGGTLPYSYAVNTGGFGTGNVLTGLAAGTHILHLRDANGCLKDSSITIGEPTAITLTVAVKRARCTPLVNGYVWLYPAGGTPGYTYAVGAGTYGASSQFNNLASGIYIFHIKDANGCIKDTTLNVLDSVFVHATYTVTNVSCYGGANGSVTITPSGGDVPYTYAVNAASYSTANPITSLAAGGYTLHVKDANGCILDTALSITQPTQIVPAIVIVQPLCYGGSTGIIQLTATNGTPGYTFANGGGAYTGSGQFTNLAAGTYTVHVKDANGCIKDTTVTMGQPTAIVYDSLIITHVKCHGDNSGTVTVYGHNGTPPYTYAQDNGVYASGNLLTGLTAGTHVVHIKDANGCIRDSTISIREPDQLHFLVPNIVQPTCEGYKNGSITIAAFGGAPQYLYAMDPQPYKTVSIYPGLGEGSYTFHVQDSNGCIYDTTIVLTGNPHIVFGIPEITPPSCFGFSNGIIKLNVSGGVPPLTYHSVSPSMTNNTGIFDTLRKGTYTFNVTDAKGCYKDTTITITQPPALSVASAATPNDCEGSETNGRVTTLVEGGTEPYIYSWSSGQNTDVLNGIGNGAYWVTVTDAHGCQDSALAVVGYDNCCKPFIPDAFTPNGDGKNDIYRLRWKGDVSKLQFSIYNRYGERVFVSYQADVGWDGTYHGKPCDMDVYFYVVKFICGSAGDNHVEYKGDVTLVR